MAKGVKRGSAKGMMRDDSGDGAPMIPAGQPLPAGDDALQIEVEFTRGAGPLGSALVAGSDAFLSGTATSPVALESELGAVLQRYSLQNAERVFTAEQITENDRQLADLRAAAALNAASNERLTAHERLPALDEFVRLTFPAGARAGEITSALRRLPEVARAVVVPKAAPPMMSLADAPPADPLIGANGGPLVADPETGLEWQWYLHQTRVPQAWRFTRGANVVIADIDWGFRVSHSELKAAIEKRYNSVDGSKQVDHGTAAGHGTAVLGIAGARADGKGMAGYAPMAALWAVQGNSAAGAAKFREPWVEGIDWARRTDAGGRRKVLIVEVQTGAGGNYEQIPSVNRTIRAAIADGCVVVVAAGNGDRPADQTDAGEPFDPTGSILVGATAYDPQTPKRAWFSNHGSRIVVSAPGDQQHDLTCAQGGDFAYRNGFGGTSGAAPKVAGTVALMLSVNPELSHADVRDILAGTGTPIVAETGKPIGSFLNAEAAVAEALRRRSEALPASPVAMPPGVPAAEPASVTVFQGLNRRQSQLVLPQDPADASTWSFSREQLPPDSVIAPIAGETPPPGDKTLRQFRETVAGTLTQQDRLLIVDQAIRMLDNFYVHRPLKEAIHAVRPIQSLRVLQRRLQQAADIPSSQSDELSFHNQITQIFNSVRDLHTNYQLPRPFSDYIAYLPFEVAPFYEDGQRRYIVTRTIKNYAFADPAFAPGAELLVWNGVAIDRAVRANAEQTAGSNEAARHARGVSSLTIRPMNTTLPPDADFVTLTFVVPGGAIDETGDHRELRQSWFVRFTSSVGGDGAAMATAPGAGQNAMPPAGMPNAAPPDLANAALSSLEIGRESVARAEDLLYGEGAAPAPPQQQPVITQPAPSLGDLSWAAALGLDNTADAVREARQLIFEPEARQSLQSRKRAEPVFGIKGSASPETISDTVAFAEIPVEVPWNLAFRAGTRTIGGLDYGHVQIRTFNVSDPDGFVAEFVRLAEQLPERGLILDVRGNGGGHIWAAERLLQTLTPNEIDPERMQFLVTPGTVDLARNNPKTSQIPLNAWQESLDEAVETGAIYSHAFPMTDRASCNSTGQRYYGPVVLVVDGNCYSATDIFAAGFQDHSIGPVLGVASNTGAGGANVWTHWLLTSALPFGWGLKPLPNQAGMRVAIRQCLRVGARGGALLEDFGVVPDRIHPPTRADVMSGDIDLLAQAAELLAKSPPRSIKVAVPASGGTGAGKRKVTITTSGIDRLDIYVDGRPKESLDLPGPAEPPGVVNKAYDAGASLRLVGYLKGAQAAVRRVEIA
ncbi:hypothetical protein NRB_17540 [Novosphingobium sp. 11B]